MVEISNNIGTENVMDRVIFTKLFAIFQIEAYRNIKQQLADLWNICLTKLEGQV